MTSHRLLLKFISEGLTYRQACQKLAKHLRKTADIPMSRTLRRLAQMEFKDVQGEDVFDALKQIWTKKSPGEINGLLIDPISAEKMIDVIESLELRKRKKFLSMPVEEMFEKADRVWDQLE